MATNAILEGKNMSGNQSNGVFAIINQLFLTIAISTLAIKLSDMRSNAFSPDMMAFAAFFLLFRFKVFLDDREAEKNLAELPYSLIKLNLLFSVLTWFFWLLAAASLSFSLNETVVWICWALGLSSVWLILEWIGAGVCADTHQKAVKRRKDMAGWLFFNIVYLGVIGSILHKWWPIGQLPFWISFGFLAVIVLVDMCVSCSWLGYAREIKSHATDRLDSCKGDKE